MSPGLPPSSLGTRPHTSPPTSTILPATQIFSFPLLPSSPKPHLNTHVPFLFRPAQYTKTTNPLGFRPATEPQNHTPSHTDHTPKPQYLSKCSRRSVLSAMDKNQLTSVYVENIPSWTLQNVHLALEKYGEIIDIFIPEKLAKNGSRFGFVRFKPVRVIKQLIEGISSVRTANGLLKANLARKDKKEVENSKGPRQPLSTHAPNSRIQEWLECSIFWILEKKISCDEIVEKIQSEGFHIVRVSEIAVDSVLIQFPSRARMEDFLGLNLEWFQSNFSLLRPWQEGDYATNRRCWVWVQGIPLQACSKRFFERVIGQFGQLVSLAPVTEERRNLEYAYLLVSTTIKKFIQWNFQVKVSNASHEIMVIEVSEPFSGRNTSKCKQPVVEDLISLSPASAEKKSQACSHPGQHKSAAGGDGEESDEARHNSDLFGLMPIIIGKETFVLPQNIGSPKSPTRREVPTYHKEQTQVSSQKSISKLGKPLVPESITAHSSNNLYKSEAQIHNYSPHPLSADYLSKLIERQLYISLRNKNMGRSRKKKRVNDHASLISSLADSDIRRVNRNLALCNRDCDDTASACNIEAEETLRVGNLIGWGIGKDTREVSNVVRELVVQEELEWSRSWAEP
ncbi:hypothetical protein Tsubulata_043375 [Turnera subulata]|uniref:RRM domain-containing protein n=1 Tax=Turnera subulata TaxID=218843 RepID=A0A9Q0FZJ0_9ROSI|nr:hypothetical protein Tsubulata_043375 [Turnera subulata]